MLPSSNFVQEYTLTCIVKGFRICIDLKDLSFSVQIRVVRFAVVVSGVDASGCWISTKTLNVSAAIDRKYAWSGNLWAWEQVVLACGRNDRGHRKGDARLLAPQC